MTAYLRIHATGPLCTLQDLGRPGLAHLGVPRSGAADRSSLRLANRILAQPEGMAALEVTLGGLCLEVDAPRWCAVTGAESPIHLDGVPVSMNAPFLVPPGALLTIERPRRGLRSYVAVRGGLDVQPVLGSCSEDILSGINAVRITPGVRIPLQDSKIPHWPHVDHVARRSALDPPILTLEPGPRHDWITDRAWSHLLEEQWSTSATSNRIGVRLDGPTLERADSRELPSEGIRPGAVQVPPSGQPVVFLADHPTTGGYPVVAVVSEDSMGAVAQLVPGDTVRFRRARWT